MDSEKKLLLQDHLSIQRTMLANERTFLAYFRTAIIFLGSGLSIYKLHFFSEIKWLGLALIILSPFVFLLGLFRFFQVRRNIHKYY